MHRAVFGAFFASFVGVACDHKPTDSGAADSNAGPSSTLSPTPNPSTADTGLVAEKSDASSVADSATAAARSDGGDSSKGFCPDDMAYVDTDFCSDVERECIDMENEEPNHLKICHKFKKETRCRSKEERRRFCIDHYEYPNKKGAHPVWMLNWYQAQATCESKGKRLCWASEWTAACEGPEHTPFAYGWQRDPTACNIDNWFVDPKKESWGLVFYSKDKDQALKELSRLDQSVPSGALDRCKSGFGVHDMTGNMDEWVVSDQPPKEKSKWAGLKGGAWGHVRSACRPMTYSHEPDFSYYFVSFRCCKDAAGVEPWSPPKNAQNVPAPPVEAKDFAPDPIVPIDAPGPTKTKCGRSDWKKLKKTSG